MRRLKDLTKKLFEILTLIGMLLVLTACADSISAIDEPPVLRAAPKKLTEPCAAPVVLPDRALKQGEAEIFWRQDRTALTVCGETKAALYAFFTDRDTRLSGQR